MVDNSISENIVQAYYYYYYYYSRLESSGKLKILLNCWILGNIAKNSVQNYHLTTRWYSYREREINGLISQCVYCALMLYFSYVQLQRSIRVLHLCVLADAGLV